MNKCTKKNSWRLQYEKQKVSLKLIIFRVANFMLRENLDDLYLLYIISQNAYAMSNDITRMKESSTIFLFSPEQDNKGLSCQ